MDFKRRDQLMALLAGICVVALLGDRLILSPLLDTWKRREEQIVQLGKSLAEGRELLGREKQLKARWREMTLHGLPQGMSVSEDLVLKSVDRWSNKCGLTMTALIPQWTPAKDEFPRLEVRASAQGSMESIAKFLYELEKDPLALKVDEIELVSSDPNGAKLNLALRFSGLIFAEDK